MNIRRILIVEDEQHTLRWLAEAVREAFVPEEVFLAENVAGAQAHIHGPLDLVLVDMNLPDGSGIDVLRLVNQLTPPPLGIVVTIYDDDDSIFPALQAGASGYLLKDLPKPEFIQAIAGIVEGRPPLSPSIARRLIRHFAQLDARDGANITPREEEVLRLIGKGLQAKKIALLLGISDHTVREYTKNIYRKLNISSRAEAAAWAVKRGLV